MKRLTLDYVSKPLAILPLVIFGVAGALTAYDLHMYFGVVDEIDRLEAKKYKIQKEQKRLQTIKKNQAIDPTLKLETARTNEIIEQLVLPWENLFNAVESAITDNTAVLSIQPDPQKSTVLISAEAKDFPSMVAFTKRLQSIPMFADCYLANHQVQQQDPQKPVRFLITATWKSTR